MKKAERYSVEWWTDRIIDLTIAATLAAALVAMIKLFPAAVDQMFNQWGM